MAKEPTMPPASQPKKLSLDMLIPDKAAVNTSLGSLYVRNINLKDWKHFTTTDSLELGRIAVQKLTSRTQDKRDYSSLSDEDINALREDDYIALTPVIAQKNGWGSLPSDAGLKELGDAVKVGKEREAQSHEKRLDEMRKSIDFNYAFLGKSSLEKLQEQMSGLASIRESVLATDSLASAMAAAAINVSPSDSWATDALLTPNQEYDLNHKRAVESYRIPHFTPPEETVLGRATLESVENSRETSQRMTALVELVGGLNQTLVEDILPAWIQKVEGDQKHAELAFKQAGKSLTWTKWAVIVSAVVSLLATSWQIAVTHTIDKENSAAQRIAENLLREQLVAQQNLSEQQALEAQKLRQLIERQSIEAEKLRNMLESKLVDLRQGEIPTQ